MTSVFSQRKLLICAAFSLWLGSAALVCGVHSPARLSALKRVSPEADRHPDLALRHVE